ncbi:hypothetical protein [Jannaschia sp. M317]|uniref:hypothetical protein n=1 Tax=Jannaschia sp. M317 TaxID=2867011 RepID=UPI0021A8B8B5|nr:hypothetical protein [Jannaschia sp. M317]UWQ17485.1 hypothetical protein K3551_16655 [Jannaschia sp. M317]
MTPQAPKIEIILCSATLPLVRRAEALADGAAAAGGTVRLWQLPAGDLPAEVWEGLDAADVIVFASQAGANGLSPRMRAFADTSRSHLSPRDWQGKLAAVLTDGMNIRDGDASTEADLWALADAHAMTWAAPGAAVTSAQSMRRYGSHLTDLAATMRDGAMSPSVLTAA